MRLVFNILTSVLIAAFLLIWAKQAFTSLRADTPVEASP